MIWYEVSLAITCIRVHAMIGPSLKFKDTCPKVHYYNVPIPDTCNGSWMILSHKIPKASSV